MKPFISCTICSKQLVGRQKRFCSSTCKSKLENNKFQNYQAQQIRGLKTKIEFTILKGGQCEICGYKRNLAALCFHHTDPSQKLFVLDSRGLSNRSRQKNLDELKKCKLLCHNCHMEHHYQDMSNDVLKFSGT